MRSLRSSFPMFAGILLCAVVLPAAPATPAGAQDHPEVSPVIAALLPSNGSVRGGQFNVSGAIGMGNGSADLAFDHPCLTSTPFPGRVSIALTYYGGEMAKMLQMQGDMIQEQTFQNYIRDLGEDDGPIGREKLGSGEIVYTFLESVCQPETIDDGRPDRAYPPTPTVRLRGLARTANARLEVTLDGDIPLDMAKATVAEIFENLMKADFGKAGSAGGGPA